MLSKCKVLLHTKATLEAELQLYALEITFGQTLQLRHNRVRFSSTHRSELVVLRSARNCCPKPAPPHAHHSGKQVLAINSTHRLSSADGIAVSYSCCCFLAEPDKFYFKVGFWFVCVFFCMQQSWHQAVHYGKSTLQKLTLWGQWLCSSDSAQLSTQSISRPEPIFRGLTGEFYQHHSAYKL